MTGIVVALLLSIGISNKKNLINHLPNIRKYDKIAMF